MQVQRKKIYDPSFEEFVDEELPTVSVKDAVKAYKSAPAGSALLLTRTLSGGTAMRITFQRLSADKTQEFYLRDREGTVDYINYPGTLAPIIDLGAPDAPVHVVQGTFEVWAGSYGTQTNLYAAYEGFVRFQGTETRA